ncbi:MAG: FMN-binding protein [Cellvibrionales bacterium]|nr:FMN-binding protein [Cellvibrionales bacterium]
MLKTLSLLLLITTPLLFARGTYQTPEAFIQSALGDSPVSKKVFWIDDSDRKFIEKIFNHGFKKLRVRYWQSGLDTVWVLDEIGKEAPITIGVHVSQGKIKQTKVLIYRESRGDEVRHSFFTQQFIDATLTKDNKLDRSIDSITGATLSVRAVTKMSRLALWLDNEVIKKTLTASTTASK